MKILIAGDYYPLSRVNELVEKRNYEKIFKEVIPIIRKNDYSIVNLEAPVVFSACKPIRKIGPNMRCTPNAVDAIKYAGFNMVTLANNHFLDFGQQGIKDTFVTLEKYALDKVGAGLTLNDAEKIVIKEIRGEKIAVINICESEFSIATDSCGGSNPIDIAKLYYQIHSNRDKVDYILVIIHGGHETYQYPSPRMKKLYRLLVDFGADAVVGHHQHCFSGYEMYNNKPIFYGLGNFSFDKNDSQVSNWNKGFMVSIDFRKDGILYEIHSYMQGSKEPGIVLIGDKYKDEINSINSVIANDDVLRQKFDGFVKTRHLSVLSAITPFSNKYLQALYKRKLLPSFISQKKKLLVRNIINCESHRDIILNVLKNDCNSY